MANKEGAKYGDECPECGERVKFEKNFAYSPGDVINCQCGAFVQIYFKDNKIQVIKAMPAIPAKD